MRTIVDIPDSELQALDRLAREDNVTRASLIRKAVTSLLHSERDAGQPDAFGLWGDKNVDGLAYQEKLRHEW